LLWGGIASNVIILIFLKYLPFLTQNLNAALHLFSPGITVAVSIAIVSIGVSYFVFQAISYLIDVYLEVVKPERHFGYFTLYMGFFPKLLQGPIERAEDLLPQLKQPYVFNYDNVRAGVVLFVWGLVKKIVIADRMALMVDAVYNDVHAYKGLPLLLSTYYYALQIYFDFSGYTDMALGTAMVFNINLTQNFKNPYFATSVADFWRRWHISFSRWILDYIFKPLQMSLRNWGSWGIASALLVTFIVSGIWHGANWGFVVWGTLHGVFMACAVIYRPFQKKIHYHLKINAKSNYYKIFQIIFVFNLISFAWIFFRANNIQDAVYIINNIFPGIFNDISSASLYGLMLGKLNISNGYGLYVVIVTFSFSVLAFVIDQDMEKYMIKLSSYNIVIRWTIYYAVILSIIILGSNKANNFIYNRF